MNSNRIVIFATVPLLILNVISLMTGVQWLTEITEISLFIFLFLGFLPQLDFKNCNVCVFLGLITVALILQYFRESHIINYIVLILSMIAYFFLYREAIKFTKVSVANSFMLLFFAVLVIMNIYFLFIHVEEIESQISSLSVSGLYFLYYINLLVFAIVGLVYYLNSYSKKSVYFITTVLAFVFSDVFRDMIDFYLEESSILIFKELLKFMGMVMAYKFMTTEERKLRLFNLA